MKNIGSRIYRFRTEKNMSQEYLADRLNVSRQAISKWENSMSVPELEKLVQMSEIFGVSLDYLIKGEIVAENEVAESKNTENIGFSNEKIKQIFGFVFLILGIVMLAVNFILAVPLIIEGIFLIFHKESDCKLIIGYSLFILLLTPFITFAVIMFTLGYIR